MVRGNWNMGVLTTACVTLGCVFGILIGGGVAPPVTDVPWLSTYQGLVGGVFGVAGAAAGLAVATHNVLRQMRINLISREEDRLMSMLPGLFEAHQFLYDCWLMASEDIGRLHLQFTETAEPPDPMGLMRRVLARKLPRTDDATREQIAQAIFAMLFASIADRVAKQGGFQSVLSETTAAQRANDLLRDLAVRIDLLQSRLPRLRAEIERYFSDIL